MAERSRRRKQEHTQSYKANDGHGEGNRHAQNNQDKKN